MSEINHILNSLEASTEQTQIDGLYEIFYEYAQQHNYDSLSSDLDSIVECYERTDMLFVQSFCLLFIGAIFDATDVPHTRCVSIAHLLSQQCNGMNDFSVFDEHHRFTHGYSHSLYLAESLLPQLSFSEDVRREVLTAMWQAYLRSDSVFQFNEDALLANILSQYVIVEEEVSVIVSHLKPTSFSDESSQTQFAIKELNKRLLWMSLRLLCEGTKNTFSVHTDFCKKHFIAQYLDEDAPS